MTDAIENTDNALTPFMRNLIDIPWDGWKTVAEQINKPTDRLEQIAERDPVCCRIRQIPGTDPIVAWVIVAPIANGASFRKRREFAAWLDLVPRSTPQLVMPSRLALVNAATFSYARC